MLKFDYTNLLAINVGDAGITEEELHQVQELANQAHQQLQAKQLPFYNTPNQDVKSIHHFVQNAREHFEHLVVLGIGGSALGTSSLTQAILGPYHQLLDGPRVWVCDNVDPELLDRIFTLCPPEKTLFNVISKSGTTAETMASFMYAAEKVKQAVGEHRMWQHFVFTTDPEQGVLRSFGRNKNIPMFSIDPGIGGRFSVLTPVGLLPAAFAGIDIDALLAGAGAMKKRCESPVLTENPAYLNAVLHFLLDTQKQKSISVMMPYSNSLHLLADWYSQLWAESLGKQFDVHGNIVHTGQTPAKALGATDQHSQVQLYREGPNDKVITFLEVEQFRADLSIPPLRETEKNAYLSDHSFAALLNYEKKATEIALTDAGRPNCTIRFPEISPYFIGQFYMLYEIQTVFAGELYRINPLDQPGVEAGKKATYALMGRNGYEQEMQRIRKKIEKITRKIL